MINFPHIDTDSVARIVVPVRPALDFTPDELTFSLRSLIDKRDIDVDVLDGMELTPNYIAFRVRFNEAVPDGECAYRLIIRNESAGGEEVASEGLATIGDYIRPAVQHNETIQFKQYAD